MLKRSVYFICLALCLAVSTVAQATQAIANWDVVPYQRISKPFKVGVVAFHETGVDVHFKINDKDAGVIKDPTLNPRTNVWEYWVEVDPALYEDGPVTIGATAVPEGKGHETRVLSPLTLYANSKENLSNAKPVWADVKNGSDEAGDGSEAKPFASIKQAVTKAGSGGTVYLKKGDYKLQGMWGHKGDYWTTVTAAPGLKQKDVTILTEGKDKSSTGRFGADKIRWKNLSIYCDRKKGWGTLFYINKGQHTWFDNVDIGDKQGRRAGTGLANNHGGFVYVTDSLVHDIANVQIGFQRNSEYRHILADIFRGSTGLLAINMKIVDINREDSKAHPDFIQFYNPKSSVENVILYNVSAYDMCSQGFFGGGNVSDVAFVNILLEKDPPKVPFLSQIGDMTHVLIWNVTMVDQTFNFRGAETMDLIYVQNGAYTILTSAKPEKKGFFIDACHSSRKAYNLKKLLGTNTTTGEMIFVDESTDDYRQAPTSPAYGSGILPPGVPADIDGVPYDKKAPNRGAFAKNNPGGRRK